MDRNSNILYANYYNKKWYSNNEKICSSFWNLLDSLMSIYNRFS